MYHLVVSLLEPYVLLHIALGIGVYWLWRLRSPKKAGIVVVSSAWGILLVLSLPIVSYVLVGSLEWAYPPAGKIPSDVQAIVVLGGGTVPADDWQPEAEPNGSTFLRCLRATQIHRQSGPRLILVSGGIVDKSRSNVAEAQVMHKLLLRFGVSASDIAVEDQSRSTFENAVEASKELRHRGLDRILLVTSARHMRRAELCFERQGLDVVAWPCSWEASSLRGPLYDYFLPSPGAIADCRDVAHEWLGMLWYWMHGRI